MYKFLVNRFLNDNMQLTLSVPFVQVLVATLLGRTKNTEIALLLHQLLAAVSNDLEVAPTFAVVKLPNHPNTQDFVFAVIPENTLADLKADLQSYINDQQHGHKVIPPYLFAFNERVATRLTERDYYRTNLRRQA